MADYFLIDRYFLVPLQFILPQQFALSRLLLRALKGITHLFTRKTQLHRLLLSPHPDKLYYYRLLFKDSPMAVLEKKVPMDLLPRVVDYQNSLEKYEVFKRHFVDQCRSTEGIDDLLEGIREAAREKGIRFESWMDLGFQGEDPKTDVRSTGIAALHHLLYLIRQYPQTIRVGLNSPYSISFACIVINCTAYLRDLLGSNADRMNYFMLYGEEIRDYEPRLAEGVNIMLAILEEEWTRLQPRDIMGFPAVFAIVKQHFLRQTPKL